MSGRVSQIKLQQLHYFLSLLCHCSAVVLLIDTRRVGSQNDFRLVNYSEQSARMVLLNESLQGKKQGFNTV